jgi:hypothetical protein
VVAEMGYCALQGANGYYLVVGFCAVIFVGDDTVYGK